MRNVRRWLFIAISFIYVTYCLAAVITLEKIAQARLSIPDQLLPWVVKVCESWKGIRGNKQRCRSIATRERWENAIFAIVVEPIG